MTLTCILQIQEYCFLKVRYESTVDWREKVDYLRCNPSFHGQPRYDCIIVDTVRGPIFARLVCAFNYKIEGEDYPIALIHPFDAAVSGPRRQKDTDFGFFRICAKPRTSCEFIFVRSIIRGALLVEDFGREGDLLVVDTVDTDMFLRLQQMTGL